VGRCKILVGGNFARFAIYKYDQSNHSYKIQYLSEVIGSVDSNTHAVDAGNLNGNSDLEIVVGRQVTGSVHGIFVYGARNNGWELIAEQQGTDHITWAVVRENLVSTDFIGFLRF
jgi:hypothetical protein